MSRARILVPAAALALLAPFHAAVHAGPNDLVLSRLGDTVTDGGGTAIDVVGSNQDFRSLTSELGVVLAPHLIAPADTLGFGGFQFAVDMAYTSISNDAGYWRALEDSRGGMMNTIGFFARKGIWLPLPSFEFGVGAVHLVDSRMWAAQGYAKFALHEGYHDLPLPSIAFRGAASRLMGATDLDLTIASMDTLVSKSFGVGGTVNLTPFGGWNVLIIVPRSEVIDKTPHIDSLMDPSDNSMMFVFRDQDDIIRNRFFAGLKFQYYVFTTTFEANFALAGSSVDDRNGTDMDCANLSSPTSSCDSTDGAAAQQTYTISIGLDF